MAAAHGRLSTSWAPCAMGQTTEGKAKGLNCVEAWRSSRSLFMRPMKHSAAGCPSWGERRAASGGCRAQGLLPDVAGLVAAGASAMGLPVGSLGLPAAVLPSLALLEEPAQWRIVAAAAVTIWYLTAKPGPVQGLLDLMWAPVAERKTTSFSPSSISLGKQLGEGSFGVVFEGWVDSPRGRQRVVLKKVKAKVAGAEEMRTSELYFNQRLQRAARSSCADFLGTCQVERGTQKGKLVEGTWLVWRYQGSSNLESFLRRRDFPSALAGPLLGERGLTVRAERSDVLQRDCAVVQAVCRHVLENLRAVHATGVVHRDVKPLNLVLDEDTLRFKLVDLGACVDLRTGFNYVPDETIMDPIYCAPEEYILPINMPDAPPGPLMSLLAPLVFMAHTPDKFDCFSAGLVLMQLAVPHLRYDRNLAQFNVGLAASGYDLDRWRKTKLNFSETDLEILDANGGAGWDLARSLLRPRDGLWCPRPTAAQALRHRFLTRPLKWATQPPPSPTAASSGKRKASRSGKQREVQQPALAPTPSPGFGWGWGGRTPADQPAALLSAKAETAGVPVVQGKSRSGPKLVDAGAKFDRKVKLKATRRSFADRGPVQSVVAWSGMLPLSTPFNARPQPAEASPARAVAEPLSGLKRLMGLDRGALPSPVTKEQATPSEYPHMAALGQLLTAAQLHQQVPVGLQSMGGKRTNSAQKQQQQQDQEGKDGDRQGRVVSSGERKTALAMTLGAATATVAGGGVLASLLVKSSMESGYSLGQGLVPEVAAAAALVLLIQVARRRGPSSSSSSSSPRPSFAMDALPTGAADGSPARNSTKGLTPAHTTWLFNRSRRQGGKEMPATLLGSSVVEMEAQLASLEATVRGGKECSAAQKELLARVEALLLDATMRPVQGRPQVP